MKTILNQKTLHQDLDIMSLALYGHACFTSFLVQNKKVKGLHFHLERLINDSFEIFGQSPDKNEILKNILAFLNQQKTSYYGGVRITVFPSNFSLSNPGDFKIFNILVTGRKIENTNASPINIVSIEAKRTCPLQKTSNIIANIKARIEAQGKGAQDALMLHNDIITEGATWNIFFGTGNNLVTPSIQSEVLPGIARKLLIEAAISSNYKIMESEIEITEIEKYEYCFISNSLIGLRPVFRINNIIYDTENPNIKYLQQKFGEIPDENIVS
ncbi:MAG: branched-subunit amino acid aminotransferase/4-amino-4-deoxychorismate lyase [Francisellaceae bacterium]|jgi:branched-subunit amino acid aminotransferase/4-amino-4-deoxychorismate lyase